MFKMPRKQDFFVVAFLVFCISLLTGGNALAQNSPVPLKLKTYEGSGQTVHPDVIFIENGFGKGEWPYWMAVTPYPQGDASKENPSIFVSFDGISWQVPPGLTNPVVTKPAGKANHNSDPELVYNNGQLIMYYRQSILSYGTDVRLYRVVSPDGVHWSQPMMVMRDTEKASLMSPALWLNDDSYVMFFVSKGAGQPGKIMKSISADGVHWSVPKSIAVAGLPADRSPWHLDVTEVDGVLHALLVTATGDGGAGSRLSYAYSTDGGDHWIVKPGFVFPASNVYDNSLQYKGTMLPINRDTQTFQVWYSARANSGTWRTLYVPAVVLRP